MQTHNSNKQKSITYDLEKRTTEFAKNLILLCAKESITTVKKPIVEQVLRSATSVGANYREANGADSKRDFRSKISICKKEAKETMFWIELLEALSTQKVALHVLWTEAHELSLIFSSITRKLRD